MPPSGVYTCVKAWDMPPRRGQKDAAAAGMNEWRNGKFSALPRFRATLCWLLHLAAAFHDHLLIVLPALAIIAQVMRQREKG